MTNYGHPIRFGVEVDADATTPGDAVDVATRAEELGYDLVALPHASADGGPDPLSLAAWTTARTSKVQIAVTRLPPFTRPAAMIARAATSLQLFSGDRAELVLDASAAPGDADTLADIFATIRSLPGPGLDREVPLGLAGSGYAIAALAGRFTDEWMTEFGGSIERFADLSATVDTAASEAGRDVREIRRSVSIAADESPDAADLITLVVDHGVSSFVLRIEGSPHGVAQASAFIEDVAPAVRDGVERALPSHAFSARRLRRADVRAQRRPGIAYDGVPEDLVDRAVEPGDAAFAKVRSTYLRGGDPGLVLRPRDVDEVASAVAFARDHPHLPLAIRSGGHGISGRSTNDGGLVIDVGALNDITILDETTRTVRIGPGARWRDVSKVLQPHGWALSSGDHGGVGVGGLATAGGIGFLSRKYGLTIDHLRAVEMVLADGRHVRASADENVELFWAARGAGANFGVAVAFEFVVDEVDQVGWAQLAFRAPDPAAYLEAFGRVVAATPRETTPFLILGQGVAQVMAMVDSTDSDTIVGQLQAFAEIAPLLEQQVVVAPYAAVMNMFPEAPHAGRGEPVARSAFAREITPGFASASADLLYRGAAHWYQIRTVGGAVADVASDATAYAHRDANFSLTVMGTNAQRVDEWFEPIRRQSDGLYLSFETDRSPDRVTDAFPRETLNRLRRLKAELDPHNLFQDNFNIRPDHADTRSAS